MDLNAASSFKKSHSLYICLDRTNTRAIVQRDLQAEGKPIDMVERRKKV